MGMIDEELKTNTMDFGVRPMNAGDILQSVAVEREAFPSLFPPTAFRRELSNPRSSYLVAWTRSDRISNGWHASGALGPSDSVGDRGLVGSLLYRARDILSRPSGGLKPGRDLIAGYLGLSYIVDEAHIVSVGVRNEYRGLGVGELLLIGAIEQAIARGAVETVTLEVRRSNQVARNLYRKYGLKDRGIRKGYYVDNREDAMIMTTDQILLPGYRDRLRELALEHRRRWGDAERVLF